MLQLRQKNISMRLVFNSPSSDPQLEDESKCIRLICRTFLRDYEHKKANQGICLSVCLPFSLSVSDYLAVSLTVTQSFCQSNLSVLVNHSSARSSTANLQLYKLLRQSDLFFVHSTITTRAQRL